jgi:hypothetical protein
LPLIFVSPFDEMLCVRNLRIALSHDHNPYKQPLLISALLRAIVYIPLEINPI